MLHTRTCNECDRVFDLLDETDAEEWAYGHDCEGPETLAPTNRGYTQRVIPYLGPMNQEG